jgi:alkanesulfonate monooxygenase SsuD/methylene tetrahydromethanopterin reductase-like flavin-dependent oxidoreductase (luciferase family)
VMTSRPELHLAVALDGAGWHPAAWRMQDARPLDLTRAAYWTELVQEAERGLIDFVTIEDAVSLQSSLRQGPDDRTDQVRGRLDAVLVAARVAPSTSHIGLVPTATVTHTEPFHVSKSIATLDYVSTGRGGWRAQVSGRTDEARHFGRRDLPPFDAADLGHPEVDAVVSDLFDEAADFVEVVRRLWDSWEDDAEIRDSSTGRFVDRDKLHYVDFGGRWFSVRGPSITPRPPQGQPLVVALSHVDLAHRFAARSADVVLVTPRTTDEATQLVSSVRAQQETAGRAAQAVHVFGELLVFLGRDTWSAQARKDRLDELAGRELVSDAEVFVGTPSGLADLLIDRQGAGLTGFRLRPGTIPRDLHAITRELVPELQRRGAFRRAYPTEGGSLRGLLGLPRPANRYAATRSVRTP